MKGWGWLSLFSGLCISMVVKSGTESEIGNGSTCYFTIPVKPDDGNYPNSIILKIKILFIEIIFQELIFHYF
jgi:hypothetical protein